MDVGCLKRAFDDQRSPRVQLETAAIAAFVAGEGAKSHPDPYTGKAFAFDPEKRMLSFESRAKGRWGDELKKRYGRAGIAL